MSKYKIGDEVYFAHFKHSDKAIPCPECFGKKFLRVILGDDSEVTVDCAGCSAGYNPPTGFITVPESRAFISKKEIERLETRLDGGKEVSEYGFDSCYRTGEENLFSSEAEAQPRAEQLARNYDASELARIGRKEKDIRTWSWNAHYHRAEIRRANASIVYHQAKLAAALTHSKDKK